MIYTRLKYPATFGVLKPEIRRKAIEIANVLLEEGLQQEIAETIAFCNARLIGQELFSDTNAHVANCAIHLIPHPEGWALISQDGKNMYAVYDTLKEGRIRARLHAKCIKFKLFIHNEDGYIEDAESFIVNRPASIGLNRSPVSRHY